MIEDADPRSAQEGNRRAAGSVAADRWPATSPAVIVEDVSFSFDPLTAPRSALDRVSLRIDRHDFLGIIGPNGGGKTTLLRIILGLLEPQSGRVRVFGMKPQLGRRRIGYVPQRAAVNLAAPATVLDVVLTGRLGSHPWGFRWRHSDRELGREALRRIGLETLAQRSIAALSGGQRQRVLIARALCGDAELLILDEPTSGVDAQAERELTDLLHRLNESLPIVVVSHDVGFVSTEVTRVACLNRTLTLHRPEDVTGESLASIYGGGVRLVSHHGCAGDHHHTPAERRDL
jgi:zinc transport system ATP-binding protein